MRFLLIDDLAHRGWKSILEKAVIKQDNNLDISLNYSQALEKIKREWDLIFLDIRLEESDHYIKDIEEYSGYKVLRKIKEDFSSTNYSTPIILLTASSRIWNIDKFKDLGVNYFYIKEHPDLMFSQINSRENLENLQLNFKRLVSFGEKKRQIWKLCTSIIDSINKHRYFQSKDLRYVNIKRRIIDKIKLGYYHLFQTQTKVELQTLLSFNEALSFLIFWSILEELAKGYTDIDNTWIEDSKNSRFKRRANWLFKNGEYFLYFNDDTLKVNFLKEKQNGNFIYKRKFIEYKVFQEEYKKYSSDKLINLSDQIYSLLAAYSIDQQNFENFALKFRSLNNFRNELDFTHGSIKSIFSKKLIDDSAINDAYVKNVEVLDFINVIVTMFGK